MFSAYPDGWPGLGLLLLRMAAASVLAAQSFAYLHDRRDPDRLFLGVAFLSLILGLLLLVGYLARFVTVLAASGMVGGMFSWPQATKVGMFEIPMTAFLVLLIAAAMICLGPGAFSIDARLFGRREVMIPQHRQETDI